MKKTPVNYAQKERDGSDNSGGRLRHHSYNLSREFFGLKLVLKVEPISPCYEILVATILAAASLRTQTYFRLIIPSAETEGSRNYVCVRRLGCCKVYYTNKQSLATCLTQMSPKIKLRHNKHEDYRNSITAPAQTLAWIACVDLSIKPSSKLATHAFKMKGHLYESANDPRTANDPGPQTIPKLDRK